MLSDICQPNSGHARRQAFNRRSCRLEWRTTMTRRILFTSQKGGVGKSTLARSTAIALAYADRKVLLADFDVDQRTCMRWQAQRVARALAPTVDVAAFSKEKKLGRVEFEYQDIVIDTRGQHDEISLDLAVS